MLRSIPFDLALVVIIGGAFRWFVVPRLDFPWLHVIGLLVIVTWLLIATRGRRLLRHLPRSLRARFERS